MSVSDGVVNVLELAGGLTDEAAMLTMGVDCEVPNYALLRVEIDMDGGISDVDDDNDDTLDEGEDTPVHF